MKNSERINNLEERIARLEQRVASLEYEKSLNKAYGPINTLPTPTNPTPPWNITCESAALQEGKWDGSRFTTYGEVQLSADGSAKVSSK